MKLPVASLLALSLFSNAKASSLSSGNNNAYLSDPGKHCHHNKDNNGNGNRNSSQLMNRGNYKAFDNARVSNTIQKDYTKDQGLVVPER